MRLNGPSPRVIKCGGVECLLTTETLKPRSEFERIGHRNESTMGHRTLITLFILFGNRYQFAPIFGSFAFTLYTAYDS